jgi:ABC-type hemin transport system substrate-binding protein
MNIKKDFRIISLVPSLTETICDFGLTARVVGCTSFCISPKELRHTVPSVGGTKDARIEDIIALKPTHVLVNREENTTHLIEQLKSLSHQHNFDVVETFLKSPLDNFLLIDHLGSVFDFKTAAQKWLEEQQRSLEKLEKSNQQRSTFQFAYFIWMNPWMVSGNQTYISSTLSLIGGINTIQTGHDLKERYPVVEPHDERLSQADILLFSSEPFPFRHRHIEEFKRVSENQRPTLKVDGQALSWYGSHFSKAILYLGSLYDDIQKALV